MSQELSRLSPRLEEIAARIMAGEMPNAGRFCGACLHPLSSGGGACPHCGRLPAQVEPFTAIPKEILAMVQAQRMREALVVRGMAYGGLLGGVIASLLPIVFWDVHWWTVLLLFVMLGVAYIGAANLANTVGDALGYRWGQWEKRRRWQRLMAQGGLEALRRAP